MVRWLALGFAVVAQLWWLPLAGATTPLKSVSPATAAQGTHGLLVTFTLNTSPPPPALTVGVKSATIGTIAGTVQTRTDQYVVTALFDISGSETPGTKDITVTFQGSYVATKSAGFTVTAAPVAAGFTASPTSGTLPLAVNFTDASTGTVTSRVWDFGDGSGSTDTNPVHTFNSIGSYAVSLTVTGSSGSNTLTRTGYITVAAPPVNGAYVVVDTSQTICYSDTAVITAPAAGQPFYGQDAQINGNQPAYQNNGDGTITDLTTGLMWVKERGVKLTWDDACSGAASCAIGGYDDWRMPTIKELYSLIHFTGANGTSMTSTAGYVPFIDTNYFDFAYGSGVGDERVIDCQDWSATPYVSTTMTGDATVFGVNFSDGRIKGYPKYVPGSGTTGETMYHRYVRGNTGYAINKFVNNGDGTISDKATRLMWARNDCGSGLNWQQALAWVQSQNAANYLGHNDWRLPNAKELQSIVDYTRSPATTSSPALSAMFNCTGITNEAGVADYPYFWTGTTLLDGTATASGVYICFGRAMGYMNGSWLDVHGAGAQRSDFKSGSPSDYPTGRGPQGDAVRIYNYVRLVRDIPASTAWRFVFVGDTHVPLTAIGAEIAAAAVDDDAKLIIVAGDLTESGAGASASTLQSELATWRDEFAVARGNGIGVYVVRGNHENDVPNGLTAWNGFFTGAYAMPGNGPSGESDLTYSLTCNNALFVGLDDYVNIHRVNQAWLNQQLAANRQPHVFVFGHEPAFKAFHTDCLDNYPADRDTFWSGLAAGGAKLYLCGHDHFLNLARIDDGDGNPANDLYQCIVGTGGTTNWPVQNYSYNGNNSHYTPINLASVTTTYGYLLVEISGPGSNDLGVTLTWKPRTYDANTNSYIYPASATGLTYTAVNRFLDSVGDGIPDVWRARYFGGTGTTADATSCATADPDHDGIDNLHEYLADTDPTNPSSRFEIASSSRDSGGFKVYFQSSASRLYTLYYTNDPASGAWTAVPTQTDILGDGGVDALTDPSPGGTHRFYRVGARVP